MTGTVASSYDDIKAVLMGCSAMSFAATAEAIFSPIGREGEKPKPRQLADRIRRWVDKTISRGRNSRGGSRKSLCSLHQVKANPRG